MIYIIAEEITFNPDDGTLANHNENDAIKLTIPASRLLEHILDSQGDILSRDFLLTEVWDKYGLRGSNSNLNQYISILRRALANYGCDNLIITIPKMGFRLNTDITLRRADLPPIPLTPSDGENAPEATQPVDAGVPVPPRTLEAPAESGAATMASIAGPRPARRDNLRKSGFLVLCIITSLLLLWALLVQLHTTLAEREIDPVNDTLAQNCQITYLKNVGRADRAAINRQVAEILNENKLRCDGNRRIIFDNYTSTSPKSFGRTMLSFCQLGMKHKIISCDNFYYYDWRTR